MTETYKSSTWLSLWFQGVIVLFAVAAVGGFILILAGSGHNGHDASAIAQNIGTALFTAGLIAFPLALLGHRQITSEAQKNLKELLATSADKILEARLSKAHIDALRADTFGKPIIEHYKFIVTLDTDAGLAGSSTGSTGMLLSYRREYLVRNVSAAPTLLEIFHHTTSPDAHQTSSGSLGFTYAYLEMGDDTLVWEESVNDSTWTRSGDGRLERSWRGSLVSIGLEPSLGGLFTIRARDLRMEPESALQAVIISDHFVSTVGAEPFVVFLPTIELEIVARCSSDVNVDLSPMYAVQTPSAALRPGPRISEHGGRLKEVSWRWGKALFAGQGVILRWNVTGNRPPGNGLAQVAGAVAAGGHDAEVAGAPPDRGGERLER
jgi:hypothetical protein